MVKVDIFISNSELESLGCATKLLTALIVFSDIIQYLAVTYIAIASMLKYIDKAYS